MIAKARKNRHMMEVASRFDENHTVWGLLNNSDAKEARRKKSSLRDYSARVLGLAVGTSLPAIVSTAPTSPLPTVVTMIRYRFFAEYTLYFLLAMTLLVIAFLICEICMAVLTRQREHQVSVVLVDRRSDREYLASVNYEQTSESEMRSC